MHQFDNYESRQEPWAPCNPGQCRDGFVGRISCFVAFSSMRERRDRIAVPLIGYSGGIVVSASIDGLRPRCGYGDDGSSYRKSTDYGCLDQWCTASDPFRGGEYGKPCGFGSHVTHAWHPDEIGKMLELYGEHSRPFKSPQFYSGYNELVYASDSWNSHLPQTIEAFFLVKVSDAHGSQVTIHDVQATVGRHRNFLRRYDLSADHVPLLTFDPARWDRPSDRYYPGVANEVEVERV